MTRPDAETDATHFGYSEVPLSRKQGLVDDVFHKVASRYDLMNDLMSGGLHRAWKSAMVTALGLPRGPRSFRLLDVAGGTGDIAFRALKRGGPGVGVTVFDINGAMLDVGRARARDLKLDDRIEFVQGNAEELPFESGAFDAVTIAFGIRNVPRIPLALKEMRRVLKPGGRALVLEFSKVDVPGLDKVYDAFSFGVIPQIGRLVAGDAEPYQYLVESIRRFPDAETFADMMREAGFDQVSATPYTGGVAALHMGFRI
ncbi:ubiquinone/menaquinone biosynthesis C-methyltransferase UbiE [Methylopila jiangsuensis]|uniref:Ubiquinone/menaquinone biosynthesis C-methyltransferase UbiE n=1 Tax=Methylopila jiangsuensis TaxID=586230 RepID=A0A9W6N4V8_9HYPH|nr:bifunctional demethylmenaquinone methyltransferase/2-methoxy-6-polyprenyl-1,4-benzoquinol methylase UbiE [Methylopila jiangsuensis]MDR6285004.1 demethylmenaquinone methyltransferase/2-methoxy-6-polyprenyl-1,4-benzoquinol methylase [Methylopila jiangsuensis]GLK77607.1 ubiquinone/menaquinone biosynthesis C-methyltransferase UbiE [Methylopila jiangsuensis]